jgi:membrane protein CcdC involved in cytochrome C biogenesis
LLLGAVEAATGEGEAERGTLALDACGEGGDVGGARAQGASDGGFKAVVEVVEALGAAADVGEQAAVHLADRDGGEALAGEHELIADGAVDAGVEGLDALLDAMLRGGDELGGGGRRGGAEVGDEIRDGEVGFVADGGDYGERGCGDGSGEGLIVKAGQVFDGAAAAGEDDEVDGAGIAIEPANAGDYRGSAAGALHGRGIDEEMQVGVAAADYFDDIVEDGAGGGGDDTDGLREGRERAFAGGVEEAFGEEAGLELLEGELVCACAARLQRVGDELELAARLVDGDTAAGEDGEAILRAEAEEQRLAAEEDDGKLRVAILEREVEMAGGRGAAVGDLAGDPDVGEFALDVAADSGDEIADGPGRGRGAGGGFDCGGFCGGRGLGRGRGAGALGREPKAHQRALFAFAWILRRHIAESSIGCGVRVRLASVRDADAESGDAAICSNRHNERGTNGFPGVFRGAMVSFEEMSVFTSVLGAAVVMAWRVREGRTAVTARKIVIPPLGMATGFSMFVVPAFRVPLLWVVCAFLLGATVLTYPLLKTSRLVRDGDRIMMKRSNSFFLVVIVLALIRIFARTYIDRFIDIRQTGALFFVLAFGMILHWRVRMYFQYRRLTDGQPVESVL